MSKSKTLLIVESPNKAKSIGKYAGDDYIVKATMGHMFDLPKNDIGIDIENNFTPKYVLMDDKKDKLKSILDSAEDVDKIMIASDPDREGEAIAWHVAQALSKTKKPIQRVEFQEITKKEVQKGLNNPRKIDDNLFHAQEARRVLDRFAGYLVSPYVIRHFGNNLSAGRVQSVVVRLIVDREREIENFKPDEYWSLIAHLSKDKNEFFAKYTEKVISKEQADSVKNDLLKSNFTIVAIDSEQKEKKAPPPFITSQMQGQASFKFKFTSSKTMELAQKLFESGYITYHRVDSFRIDEEALQAVRQYLKENNLPIPNKPNFFKDKDGVQAAHGCIRPTDVYRKPEDISGSDAEKKLYGLIRDRFLACQMSPAVYDTVSVKIESSVGKHILKALGRILREKGWLEIMDDDEKSSDIKLPAINKNEIWELGPKKISSEQKFTKPPPRFTEQTLIKELESRKIGRPSTYAAITAKVRDRNYVTEKNTIFYPTDLGSKITDDLTTYFDFLKYDYTADIEEKLDKIANGSFSYLDMMKEFYPLLAKQLKDATFSKKTDYGFNCSKCDSLMDLRQGKFGYFLSCINYPDCKSTLDCVLDKDGKPVLTTRQQKLADGVKCQRCGEGMVKKDGKFGPFYSCSTWPKCTAIQQIPYKKCSKCQGDMTAKVIGGELKLSCINYQKCGHTQPIPKNIQIDWINPNEINKGKINKKTEKIMSRDKNSHNW